jgi:hypothetical protein
MKKILLLILCATSVFVQSVSLLIGLVQHLYITVQILAG